MNETDMPNKSTQIQSWTSETLNLKSLLCQNIKKNIKIPVLEIKSPYINQKNKIL